MKSKNPELFIVMKAYVFEAIELLKKRDGAVESIPQISEVYWIKRREGEFSRKHRYVPHWSDLYHNAEAELMELNEYKSLILELTKDKRITVQFNKQIGTLLSTSIIKEKDLIKRMVVSILKKVESIEFNKDIFEKEYAELEDFLYSSVISCGIIAPLSNFMTEIAPIHLKEGLCIDRLKDDEIIFFLEYGIFPALASPFSTETPQFALRFKYNNKKIVEGQDEEGVNEVPMTNEDVIKFEEQLDDVMHTLRIFKSGVCSLVVKFQYHDNWLLKGSSMWHQVDIIRENFFTQYSLSKDEANGFKKFWGESQSKAVKKQKFIDVACKRFSFANERNRPEDKLVDLMISAEALFLSDSGDAKYRGELRYRLALRVGFFVGKDGKDRKKIFEHMKHAYDVRSSLVHGGKLKLPMDTESLDKFVEKTEDILRTSIHKAIDLAAQDKLAENSLVEWDELIID